MKKSTLAAFIFTMTLMGAAAQGNNPITLSHSYFDLGYERVFYSGDLGANLEDANGFNVELSAAPTDFFFLMAEYHYAEPDLVSSLGSVDTQDLRLGLGGNVVLAGIADLYLQGGTRYMEIPAAGTWDRLDDWGFYLEPGLRVAIIPSWEVYVSGDYTRIAERNLWAGEMGTVFKFTDMLGVEVSGRFEEDRSTLGVGGRLQW
jgi:hypothetical protein